MEIKSLALSYFAVGLPPKYRRRSSVSHLSSGWVQCGSTTPKAPGKPVGQLPIASYQLPVD